MRRGTLQRDGDVSMRQEALERGGDVGVRREACSVVAMSVCAERRWNGAVVR
jgi:hypothetical protein